MTRGGKRKGAGRPTTTGRGRTAGAREARAWLNVDEWAAVVRRAEAEAITVAELTRRAIAIAVADESAMNIRRQLAPLLGCDVDHEPADSMVGRMVALYEARDERAAEKRGYDKAMEWAAVLAGDFDPFSADWSDVERAAGERVLGLFADKLRRAT